MSLHILGIGTAVPQHAIDQSDAAEQVAQVCCDTSEQQRMIKLLYRRAGVKTRHSVLLESATNGAPAHQSFYTREQLPFGPTTADRMDAYHTLAAPLALAASRRALDDAGTSPEDVTHLVTVSCSGFSAPGVDIELLQRLPLAANVARTHVGFMGCHAALNGLRVARAYAEADPQACVLVCAVELCSLHHQYLWDPEQIVANALFADGAAAVVGRSRAGVRDGWQVASQGSAVIDASTDMMSWRIGNHGFRMTLSSQLPLLIEQTLRPWLDGWLAEHDLTVERVGSWAVHPGGPRILDACAKAIGVESRSLVDSWNVFSEFGNMSSPTLLFIVERMIRRAAPHPCVALAFGPGITVEAALLA